MRVASTIKLPKVIKETRKNITFEIEICVATKSLAFDVGAVAAEWALRDRKVWRNG